MTPGLSPARQSGPSRFETRDIDDDAKHFCDAGIDISIRPLGARSGRIALSSMKGIVEGVNFACAAFEEPVEIVPRESFDAMELLFPVMGTTAITLGAHTLDLTRQHGAIFDVQRLDLLKRSAASENYGVFIDQKILTGRLFELPGMPVTRKLEFTPELDLTQPPVVALKAFLTCLEGTNILPSLNHAPQSRRRLAALVADMVLELLPHNYRDALQRVPGMIAPRHVKRAIDYIQANAQAGICSEDLVRISGVSLRALQYGFRKFLGASISEYERSIRLDRARRDIERDPAERIAVICERWGFSNFTRFNTQFEAAFGVNAVALRKSLQQR